MHINLYSSLRNIAGRRSIDYKMDGAISLLDLLTSLTKDFPAFKPIFFDQDGALSAQMPVFLNGKNPRLLPDGLHTNITHTDVISLFTPIASGKMNVEAIHHAAAGRTHQEDEDEN